MAETGSITGMWDQLKQGNDEAVTDLWLRFIERIRTRANRRLSDRRTKAIVEPDDAAIEVFDTLVANARAGRFPNIASRDDLFRLLLVITDRKCINLSRQYNTQKQGGQVKFQGPAKKHGSELSHPVESHESCRFDAPEDAAAVADTYEVLISLLSEYETLQLAEIANMRIAGWSNRDIAKQVDRSEKTVEKRMKLIREIWSDYDPQLASVKA